MQYLSTPIHMTEKNLHDPDQSDHPNELDTHSQARIFHQLSDQKKNNYFTDQYGTVKGMTGFFDYRFKKGIKDVQTFTLNDQEKTVISACIALSG
jgi:hypothetical protein